MKLHELFTLDEIELSKQMKAAADAASKINGVDNTNIEKILLANGYSTLGDGAESIVAVHPKRPWALKILTNKFSNHYNSFVNFCYENKTNPHIPKFNWKGGLKTIPNTNGMYNYIEIEKLTQLTKSDFVAFISEIVLLGASHQSHAQETEKIMRRIYNFDSNDMDELNGQMKEFLMKTSKLKELPLLKDFYRESLIPDAAWIDLCVKFSNTFTDHRLDLHSGNFMMRGRTLVLTDPIAPY